jgi:hypothetical protein
MEFVFVKPKAGRRVINTDLAYPAPLASEGATVIKTLYWLRRFKDGDIEMSTVPQPEFISFDLTRPVKKASKTGE